jgi:hypothetical protein
LFSRSYSEHDRGLTPPINLGATQPTLMGLEQGIEKDPSFHCSRRASPDAPGARSKALNEKGSTMPSDMPSSAPAATVPYYRVVAFVLGGGITLALLLLLTNLGYVPSA